MGRPDSPEDWARLATWVRQGQAAAETVDQLAANRDGVRS